MQIFSFSPFGYEGTLVSVEVDLRRGIPAVDVVGLADGAVKESRERMRAAIRNSGFEFPLERVLISLSPADLKKEGAGFDLALALAVLNASAGDSSLFEDEPILVLGELELSGAIRPVRAVHAAATTAFQAGIKKCIVPSQNILEAREVSGMEAFGADSLHDAFCALSNPELFTGSQNTEDSWIPSGSERIFDVLFPPETPGLSFSDIRHQERLVRALQIAAAGAHNVLAFGPPGCGKTLALQRFGELLPLLSVEEAQSVTRIWSLAGLLSHGEPLLRIPPFRQPHQTASIEGICGGGTNCRPGEISLSHNGVLFLDEAAEFKTSVLQMLRVPLESASITLSRAGRTTTYPARFQLLLATNPCPCGNYGVAGKICLCSARSVEHYWRKFSGPLLDRVDIRVSVPTIASETVDSQKEPVSTRTLREGVARAVSIQRERQQKRNAELSVPEIAEFCPLSENDRAFLDSVAFREDLSLRAVSGIVKTARTIADIEGTQEISRNHIEEAVSFRANVGPLSVFACA